MSENQLLSHDPLFKRTLIVWGKTDIRVALALFAVVTVIRFVAETIPPLWFLVLILYLALPLLTIPKTRWPRIWLQKPQSIWPIGAGIAGAFLIKAVTILFLFTLLGQDEANWMLGIARHYKEMPSQPAVVKGFMIFFMVMVPLVEEVFFRMIQAVWQSRFGMWMAIGVSAFLFGFSHIDEYLFPFAPVGMVMRLGPVMLYGILHAWCAARTGSTFTAMITHLLGNAAEAVLLVMFIVPIV